MPSSDLAAEEQSTELAALAQTLKENLDSKQVFASVGAITPDHSNVLCALNPWTAGSAARTVDEKATGEYRPEVAKEYVTAADLLPMRPHAFGIAEAAVRATGAFSGTHGAMSPRAGAGPKSQVVVVQGVSGSGKTFLTRQLFNYLSSHPKINAGELAKKAELAHNLLEFFDCALTNDNALHSLSVQLWTIQIPRSQALSPGISVNSVLNRDKCLIQTGVPAPYVFYALFSIPTLFAAPMLLQDSNAQTFRYTKLNSHFSTLMEDSKSMQPGDGNKLMDIMTKLGLEKADETDILKVLAAILQLGNVMPFSKQSYASSMKAKPEAGAKSPRTTQFSTPLGKFCKLLKLSEDQAVDVLSQQEKNRGGQKFKAPRNAGSFQLVRDGLARALLRSLRRWLLQRICYVLNGDTQGKCQISLLDAPATEVGEQSGEFAGLDALCQRYSEEKIQQFFCRSVIAQPQKEYEEQALRWDLVNPHNRQGLLDLMEGWDSKKDIIKELQSANPNMSSMPYARQSIADPRGSASLESKAQLSMASESIEAAGLLQLVHAAHAQASNLASQGPPITAPRLLKGIMETHRFSRYIFAPKLPANHGTSIDDKRREESLKYSFGVHHYTGDVVYDVRHLLPGPASDMNPSPPQEVAKTEKGKKVGKDKDEGDVLTKGHGVGLSVGLEPQILAWLKSSDSKIVKFLCEEYEKGIKMGTSVQHGEQAGQTSIASITHQEVAEVSAALENCSAHFIRCLHYPGAQSGLSKKPKLKEAMSPKEKMDTLTLQVKTQSLVEAARLRQKGYAPGRNFKEMFLLFFPFVLRIGAPGAIVRESDIDDQSGFFPHPMKINGASPPNKSAASRYVRIRDFVEGLFVAIGVPPKQLQSGGNQIFVSSGKSASLIIQAVDQARKGDFFLAPEQVPKLEHWLLHKRMMHFRFGGHLVGIFQTYRKLHQASKVLCAAVLGTVGMMKRREEARALGSGAHAIAQFVEWVQRGRQVWRIQTIMARVMERQRKERKAEEERQARSVKSSRVSEKVLADLAEWLSNLTGEYVPRTLLPALRSGEIMCDLLPCIDPKFKVKAVNRRKKQAFFARDNIVKAMEMLKEGLECPEYNLFTPDDLLSDIHQQPKKVVYCLQWIARHAFLEYDKALPSYIQEALDAGEDLHEEQEEDHEKKHKKPRSSAMVGATSLMPPEEKPQTRERAVSGIPLEGTEENRWRTLLEDGIKLKYLVGSKALVKDDDDDDDDDDDEELEDFPAIPEEGGGGPGAATKKSGVELHKCILWLDADAKMLLMSHPDHQEDEDHKSRRAFSLLGGLTAVRGKQTEFFQLSTANENHCLSLLGRSGGGTSLMAEVEIWDLVARSTEKREEALNALQWLAGEGGQGPSLGQHTLLSHQRLAMKMAELEGQFLKCWAVLTNGSTFQQYKGAKVFSRWLFAAPPRDLRKKEEAGESILFADLLAVIEQVRLVFTTTTDHSAPTALIKAGELEYIFAGKRDGGSGTLFPTVGGESVAEDAKCFVIGAKHTVGLEAPSHNDRNQWVAALEWLEQMVQLKRMQLEEAEKKSREVHALDPLLVSGGWFTKHGLKGVNQRLIKCTVDRIYWLKSEQSPLEECIDPIEWEHVTEILRGKQTTMFHRSRAQEVSDELCISVKYRKDNRTLDLVAATPEQAFEWYEALSSYLAEAQERFAPLRAQEQEGLRNQLADVQKLLDQEHAERSAVHSAATDIEKSRAELEARKAALQAEQEHAAKELERTKNDLAKERDDLIMLIQDLDRQISHLRNDLDEQLSVRANILKELDDVKKETAELPAVRAELEREKKESDSLSLDLNRLLEILNKKLVPAWKTLQTKVENEAESFRAKRASEVAAAAAAPAPAPVQTTA